MGAASHVQLRRFIVDEIRLMLPEKRNALPRWELKRDGIVVGWIHEVHIGRTTRPFFTCIGVDLENGNLVNLGNSADFGDRVRVVHEFRAHPERSVHRLSGIIRS